MEEPIAKARREAIHSTFDAEPLISRIKELLKKLLKVMFLSIYFDPTSNIRLILAHEPFNRLLPISQVT